MSTNPSNPNNASSNTLSDSDDSGVVVEHDDVAVMSSSADEDVVPDLADEAEDAAAAATESPARPYQIVSIGTEEDSYAFHFDEAKLQEILAPIPVGAKVAVLSVVGAFRTGKSFLLSWFLRYLNHLQATQGGGKKKAMAKQAKAWYEEYQTLGNDGFEWKAGSDRNTTGIWMWSRPFFLPTDDDDDDDEQPMALLLVDTQGMFDHETTMSLTASIFGFSTLLSSFQIYNVDKRIQEDNLQQLALFSEYARIAVAKEHKDSSEDSDAVAVAAVDAPFQRMEFLVRDWQHFEDEDESLEAMEKSMGVYLNDVLKERDANDLKDTRAQITACFADLTCYGLCHPGFAVTKKKFTGDVKAMEELFVKLLDRYCKRVFKLVQPKKIHGRALTAVELGSYITAYAKLFESGAHFPTAVTLLEATATANNANAIQMGIMEYTGRMDRVAGPRCTNYLPAEELEEEHAAAVAASLNVFCEIANFGSDMAIAKAKRNLQDKIHDSHSMYESLNDGRNPLKGIEMYLIAFFIALVSYVVRTFLDITCAPHATLCKVGSELASHASAVVWCFLFILMVTRYQQLRQHGDRLWRAFQVVIDAPPQAAATASASSKAKSD